MSSWIFETYSDGNRYAEYRWDKGGVYAMLVGHKVDGLIVVDYHNTYSSREKARQAFKRQVVKIKREA